MKSGIYQIVNIINSKRYIGSSNNISRRFIQHKHSLSFRKHKNMHLETAWHKYGASSFLFEVIEYCPPEELESKEQLYLDKYKKSSLYNKRSDATNNTGNKLGPLKPEHRAKLSGRIPWNKGLKGVCKSNSSSFSKGIGSWNKGAKTGLSWNRGTVGLQTAWNKGLKGYHPEGFGTKPMAFSVVSPDGIYYEGYGIRKFAEEMGLTTHLIQLVKGNIKTYRGWRLPKGNEVYNGYGFFPTDNKIIVRNQISNIKY